MATRHEITSIQFKADAGKANAAIDSIRQKAKEANDQMTQLRQKLEEGKKANLPIEDLAKMEAQLKSATKEAKQWGDAQRNLMRGVKALDEAIIQFNRGQGSVEKMSAALSKAARNAAQLQQSRMERGSQGWQEMEALITALDKNLVKARQDFDSLVQTIEQGGRVSVSELSSAKQSLKELSDLTAYGSDEWKQYQAQLDAVTKRFDSLSQTEKRLAGEIVTVEDARKRAAAADAEAAQKREANALKGLQTAKEDAATAQASLETSKQKIVATEQEIAKTKEQLAAQQQLVGSIEALEDAESKAFSKTLAADTALQKQREETNKFSDATWEAAKKVGELETKLKELEAHGGTPKGNATLEQLKKDIETTTEELGTLEQKWQDKISDYVYSKYPTQATVSAKTKSPEGLKEREAMRQDPVLAQMREQSKKELDAVDEKLMRLIRQERELTEVTEQQTQATQASVDVDKQKAELQQQLTHAQQKLNEAKTAAEGPIKALKEAEEAYADAQKKEQEATEALAKAKGNMNLGEEEDKLDALERKHDDLTESLQKQKQAEQELAQNAADTRQKEKEAAIELAQAQNQSEESLKKSVEVLEQQNKTLDAGSAEWIENEQAIGKLNKRIEELKQQSQELRGEMMSLAEAEELADKAMEEQALTTKTGWAASTEELKRAEQTLADKVTKAKRGTAEEEAAYQKLVRQLQAVRTELGAGSMSGKQMMDVLSNPKNVTSVDTLKAAIGRARQELDALGRRIDQARMDGHTKEAEELAEAYDDIAEGAKNADQRMKELQSQSKGTASAFDKAWSRLKTYVGLYVGAAVAMQKLTAAMGDLLTLSDKMGEVRKTTGFTADEVGRLSENLAKLDTRTTLTQLMELSSLAGSVGLKTQEQVQGFTEAADQLIVALPELGNESARTIIKIANATGDLEKNGGNVRETLEKVGSTIIALRANSASAAGPITDFVSRVGAVGAQAGISIDQIAALGSTIDALGGRVEMSATALSRMIPAIKNNSFAIANSINITEKELKKMTAMEQMVLILQKMRDNIAGIDTSTEEGMNAMADNVEAFLGKNATMREVMKDLEQQGSRAGIVFGLLSQNVDELQKQLGIASEAYEKNTALANEFANMNETTAAKWERLKNQFEEAFVGDQAQRWLGTIIDGLRKIVDLLTDNGTIGRFMRYSLIYLALLKAKWAETIGSALISMGKFLLSLRASTIAAQANTVAQTANAAAVTAAGNATAQAAAKTNIFAQAWGKMNTVMKANVVTALATALIWLGTALWDAHKAAKASEEAYTQLNRQINEEKAAVDRLFRPLKNANIEHAEKERLIKAINSQYGSYLGKMLTEASSAQEIARAYAAINLQLEKKNLLEGIEANKKRVQEQQGGYLDSAFGEMDKAVTKASKTATDASAISAFIAGAVKDAIEQGLSPEEMRKNIQSQLKKEISEGTMKEYVQIISGGMSRREESDRYIANAAVRYYNAQKKVQDNAAEVNKRLQADLDNLIGKAQKAADKDIPELIADYSKALSKGNDASKYTAKESSAVVEAFDAIKAYYDMHHDELSDAQKERISATLDFDISKFRTKANAAGGGQFHNGSNSPTPYGTYNRVTSPYQDWDADALVSRRKEMLERVRALANGADVQAVLSEDAKFITEATRKNIKTTRDAIEWYNTERLKIQDALHEKHLTNTGDWMDPTGRRKREKTVKDEWSTYLNELDAYYTERKAKIQEQQNDGEISEAESWRRQLTNEAEWRQRRAELQQLYARKSAEVTEEEQQAIFNIIGERTGDSADFIRASIAKTVQFIYDIGKHSEAEMNNLFGRMDKGSEQDFLRQRNAIGKQMDAIRDIIEKERPFNGITENLQENLTKMGVLFGDMDDEMKRLMAAGEDMAEFNAKQEQERVRRLSFLLQEAEHAYNTNIEEVMRNMAEAGMTEWVDYFKNNTDAQNALMAQLHTTFDKVQEAIKKEASLWKKEAENMWNNILLPDGETTLKQLSDRTVAALSLDENRVSRANSLIGAGQASERVADRLALQQMKVQLAMQEHYYNIMHQRGRAAIDDLERQAKLARERGDIEEATRKELDAQHARMTLNLATAKEETDLAKQREEIIARTEESQNRLYKELKSWADLLTSSLQSVFEATHAGDAEYFNERAKLNLTGKGGPGAGTYIVIDNEGTSDATAHYEYLNEREALERQREIANQNALADALKKALDDINMKMSEQITDWINASLQSASLDANTQAVLANTQALYETAGEPAEEPQGTVAAGGNGRTAAYGEGGGGWMPPMEMPEKEPGAEYVAPWTAWAEQSSKATETMVGNNKKVEKSTKASFAAMTAAANMYGIAYQAMSNENLSTAQKVEMMIVQAAGQAAISMLTASLAASEGETAANAPSWISKTLKELGPIGGPVAVGVFTALIGGLMGLATSKITKSKSEIAQVTGASHASAGRLSTGMLQYAEGNVNEFTDPSTLQTGKQYNVDAADGRTYRARFMGKGAKTHITHGPEFHLVGEAGREAIIDAKTTQNIRMNEPEIWRTIQILSGGGRISAMRRRGRGVAAFADGNVDEMGGVGDMGSMGGTGMSAELTASLQASLDRNSDIMERIATEGIKGIFDVYGKDGLVETYDRGKKTMSRYGKN